MHRSFLPVAAGAFAVLLGACASVEQLAPPTTALRNCNANAAQGREIYLTNCTKCHGVKPVLATSLQEWQADILPKMCAKAKLDPGQRQCVLGYITAVHTAAPSLKTAQH